jgi:hypothetical protein
MIISASRRTDIPAFYSQWFMNRLREGYCLVPNPFNARQVARVSLVPESVDAIVFWSKNPAPMIPVLPQLEERGYVFDKEPRKNPETEALLSHMAVSAAEHGLETFACAEKRDYTYLGIRPSSCIDAALIRELWGIPVSSKKDPGQREHRGCALSRDIGMADTCPHGCPYCYSNLNPEIATGRYKVHNPRSTALIGSPEPPGP